MADHLELDISAIWYNIVLVQIKSTRHARDEFSSSIVEAEETLKAYESESDVLAFERSLEGKALLFKGDSREEIEEKEKLFLEVLQKTIGTYHHLVYYVGMGEPVNRLRSCRSPLNRRDVLLHIVICKGEYGHSQSGQ